MRPGTAILKPPARNCFHLIEQITASPTEPLGVGGAVERERRLGSIVRIPTSRDVSLGRRASTIVVVKDRLPPVPASDHVIKPTPNLNPRPSCHYGQKINQTSLTMQSMQARPYFY